MSPPSETLLKTRQVADALGVGVSTVKRWVNAGEIDARKTLGGHRLIELSTLVRFARERGLPLAAVGPFAEPAVPAEIVTGRGIDQYLRDDLATALKRGRAQEARVLILQAHAAGADAAALGDHLVRPVMEQVGHDWETGGLDVYQEHRASHIVESVLIELIQRQGRGPEQGAPLALGSAPEGDIYTLSGLLCELTLRELGWDVMNLGANLPLASLAKAVRVHHPRLVWLTVSHLADARRFVAEYRPFFETATALGAAVILGGSVLRPELRAELVAASFGDRLAHLAEFARRIDPRGSGRPPR